MIQSNTVSTSYISLERKEEEKKILPPKISKMADTTNNLVNNFNFSKIEKEQSLKRPSDNLLVSSDKKKQKTNTKTSSTNNKPRYIQTTLSFARSLKTQNIENKFVNTLIKATNPKTSLLIHQSGLMSAPQENLSIKTTKLPERPRLEQKVLLSKKIEVKKKLDKCKVKHISGTENHFEFMKKILSVAETDLLITSYSVTWIPQEVYELFIDASERGVKIRIVYNNEIDLRIQEFFENNNIGYEQSSIHGKYLISDREYFVVGSHNWLDFRNIDYDTDSLDRSFKISKNENYVNQLRGKVWSEIISHRTGPSEKKWDFKKLSISNSSHMLLLTTLFDHENFLLSACSEAKKRIEIHSPFVTYKNAIKRLSDIAAIFSRTTNSNVKLHIVVGEVFKELKAFIQSNLILRKNTYIYLDDFHRKTLIIDDELISEGSFNWLSTANSLDSEYHNQDTSLVLRGSIAGRVIKADPIIRS